MSYARPRPQISDLVRRLLYLDAAIEFLFAVALTGLIGRVHFWLNVERPATLAGAVVFAVAGVAVLGLAIWRATPESAVRALATANVGGGVAVWVAALLNWSRFESEGQWLVIFAADLFIALGVLQLLALRKNGR